MLQLNKIDIKNYIIYDQATLNIEPGVTTIRGKNLDRKSKRASNGAGKSIMPGVVPGIFYDATPLPMKSKKNTKEGFSKGTELNLKVTDRFNNSYCIKKFFKSSVKMDLVKNGKPLKFRKKNDAKDRLLKIMPLNEDQFYTLVYLDTKRPSVFQYGTDAQRHHFIESLYKLNIYDKLAEHVKRDWDKNKELVQELELLDRQLSQKQDENPGDPEELKKRQDALLKKVTELRDKVSDLLQKLQECRTYEALADGLDLSVNTSALNDKLTALSGKFKSVRKQLEAAREQNQQYEAFKSVNEKRREFKNKLKLLKDVKVDKTIQDKLRVDRALLNEIAEINSRNEAIESEIKSLKTKDFSDLNDKYKKQALDAKPDLLKKALVQERTKLRELEANLKETEDHLSGDHQNCPVCNSSLSENIVRELIIERKSVIKRINVKIKVVKEMIAYSETEEKLKQLKAEIKSTEDFKAVEKRIDENEALVQSMRNKVIYTAKLKSLPEVEEVEPVSTDRLVKDHETFENEISDIKTQITKHENLEKLSLPFKSLKQAKRHKNEYESALSELRPLLDKFQAKSHAVAANLSKSEVLLSDITSLSKSVNELKLKTGDYKVLTSLRKAFGAKGIRRQRVAQIGVAIEDSLNTYSKMLFDFPIKFQLVITDTKFQILAQRNGQVSDVRTLSGAESKYFSLLCLVALLPFCPNSHRIDTVIADEIEANMDESFRRRYIDIFLPELLKIVPKVIIITPLSEREFYIKNAHSYMVTKKHGKSILRRM